MAFANLKEPSFIPAPAGTHAARLIKMVDLGTQTTFYGLKHQLLIEWELPNTKRGDGKPFTVSEWYTASLSRLSNFRRDIEGWLGRGLFPEELNNFSPALVAEIPCLLSVAHKISENDVMRAQVEKVKQIPDGMSVAERVNDLLIFDLNNPDIAVLEKLPETIQERIENSPEWEQRQITDTPPDDPLDDVA